MATVTEFGARGDGRTDDTQAIQRALNEGGGHLLFPEGTYLISRPIEVDLVRCGRTGIAGAEGCATLVMAGPGPALRLVGSHEGTASPASFTPAVRQTERLPMVSNLEIAGAHPEAIGIHLEALWQPTLTGVHVRDCLHGIHVVRRNRNLVITACHVYNNRGVGVFYDHVNLHQSNILGCHISYNKGGGIKVLESEIRNLQITGNDIEYNVDHEAAESADIWIESRLSSVREGTIASNTIQAVPSPGGANIRIRGWDDATRHKVGHWAISGNLISSQEVNVHLAYARNVVITGNVFYSGHERSLRFEHCDQVILGSNGIDRNPDYRVETGDGVLFERCDGCLMTGMVLKGSRGDGPDAAAVEIRGSTAVRVAECQILEAEPCGVLLQDSADCAVTGCTIRDRRQPARLVEAIRVVGGASHLVERNQTD